MILGIDVGGTHTDAVLIDGSRILRKIKVLTDTTNTINSLLDATDSILNQIDSPRLKRIVLSTTISTNAIVQHRTAPVGMIVACGPGLPPSLLPQAGEMRFVSGYMNHRGLEVTPIDEEQLKRYSREFRDTGITYGGVVGKFSTRNPSHEIKMHALVSDGFKYVSMGHRLSGRLNFPRRLCTTYLNSAVYGLYNAFVREVRTFAARRGLDMPIYILKADGGTIEISRSGEYPVQTILSGPAASIMGIISMARPTTDAVALDIGGTTTDIAVFADGVPLLEDQGITIEGYKTLIRGLQTRSIGIGGDSWVRLENGRLRIGPEREGPAASLGGDKPTPTDAMVVLGRSNLGDRNRAAEILKPLAAQMGKSVEAAAEEIINTMVGIITDAVTDFLHEINNQPVYTVRELLDGKTIDPRILYVVGGPAHCLAPSLGERLKCPHRIPYNAEVANAVGAALARTTAELTIVADTERRFMTIGEGGLHFSIPAHFTKEDAIRIGREKLRETAAALGSGKDDMEIETVEDMEFNMVRDFYTSGKNIRVKLQIKPGLISGTEEGEGR